MNETKFFGCYAEVNHRPVIALRAATSQSEFQEPERWAEINAAEHVSERALDAMRAGKVCYLKPEDISYRAARAKLVQAGVM